MRQTNPLCSMVNVGIRLERWSDNRSFGSIDQSPAIDFDLNVSF